MVLTVLWCFVAVLAQFSNFLEVLMTVYGCLRYCWSFHGTFLLIL